MTDHVLPTARPAYAVVMWCDSNHIYIELPCKEGPPYITKYDLTEGGLSKALHLMRDSRRKAKITGDYNLATQAKITRATGGSYTEGQRENARSVLRKMKLIG